MNGRGYSGRQAWLDYPGAAPPAAPRTDRDAYEYFFHGQPEADVHQFAAYQDLIYTLGATLETQFTNAWVAWDTACYWTPGNNESYAIPSLFVATGGRPEAPTQSYRRWEHGQILFALDVGTRRTRSNERGPRVTRFSEGLWPQEYLYFDPARDELHLFRRSGDTYPEVTTDPLGWVYSEQLMLWFGIEGRGWLRVYDRDRQRLQTRAEADARRQEAERAAAVANVRRHRQDLVDAAVAERRAEVRARLTLLETEMRRRRDEARTIPVVVGAPALRLPGRWGPPAADDGFETDEGRR